MAAVDNLSHADLDAVLSGTIVREDVLSTIIDVSREDLEFTDRAGSGSVTNKGFSWPMDRLQAQNLANARVDGADVDQNDAALGQRVYNQEQLSDKEVKVSLLGEAANSIGSMGKLTKQVQRRGQEMMRDIEGMVLSNIGAQLDDGDLVPGITAGLETWIDGKIIVPSTVDPFTAVTYTQTDARQTANTAGTILGGGWALATVPSTGPDAWAYTTVTPGGITETLLKAVSTGLYKNTNSRKDRILMLGVDLNNTVTDFYFTSSARIATLIAQEGDASQPRMANGALNSILTNYGRLDIVPNSLQPIADVTSGSESAFFLDFSLLEFANMTGFRVQPLAKTGHAEKRLLGKTWGLRVLSSEAQGIIQGIDSAIPMVA